MNDNNHGGRRIGAGRPKSAPKKVTESFYITVENSERLKSVKNKSDAVNQALDDYFNPDRSL